MVSLPNGLRMAGGAARGQILAVAVAVVVMVLGVIFALMSWKPDIYSNCGSVIHPIHVCPDYVILHRREQAGGIVSVALVVGVGGWFAFANRRPGKWGLWIKGIKVGVLAAVLASLVWGLSSWWHAAPVSHRCRAIPPVYGCGL